MSPNLQALIDHQAALRRCRRCANMTGPAVVGKPVLSPVILVGQAPGAREIAVGRPFVWTAGRTLFGWLREIGLAEDLVRDRVYMAAVCRCFPGRKPSGGDRAPDAQEIANCAGWLAGEMALLRPRLILPVGKLAAAQFLPVTRLVGVVGRSRMKHFGEFDADIIPLPHPSGASTWHRTEPGRRLLRNALDLIRVHPAWREICSGEITT